MPNSRALRRAVVTPHRKLSPWWIGGALLSAGGFAAIAAIALTPVRRAEPQAAPIQTDPAPVRQGAAETAPAPASCHVPYAPDELEQWTIGPRHFGPLVECSAITVESMKRLLPGYTIDDEAFLDDPTYSHIVVSRDGRRVLDIRPQYPEPGGPPIAVAILGPDLVTPWGIRVGDTVRELFDHHPAIDCRYGAAEDDETFYCRQDLDEDGWTDPLIYTIDIRRIDDATRRYLERQPDDGYDLAVIGKLRVISIYWSAPDGRI